MTNIGSSIGNGNNPNNEVHAWLISIKMEKYIEIFKVENFVTLDEFKYIYNENDLTSIGIEAVDSRIIWEKIVFLKTAQYFISNSSGTSKMYENNNNSDTSKMFSFSRLNKNPKFTEIAKSIFPIYFAKYKKKSEENESYCALKILSQNVYLN